MANPANNLPRFAEYLGKTATVLRFVVKMSGSQIVAGILNITKTGGDHSANTGTFGERGERLVKTWECLGKILRISQIRNSPMSQCNSRQPAEFRTAVTLLCLIRFTKSFEFRMLHVSIKKVWERFLEILDVYPSICLPIYPACSGSRSNTSLSIRHTPTRDIRYIIRLQPRKHEKSKQSWSSVVDGGPALCQNCFNVSCLLDSEISLLANARRSTYVILMLGQRRRRWNSNIKHETNVCCDCV